MKTKFRLLHRRKVAALGLPLGLALLLGYSASAANPVVNGNFENPLSFGSPNWTVVYVIGGPDDFAIQDRTTAGRNGGAGYGVNFKPMHDGLMHAYLKQTVSGLTPNAYYAVTNWMVKPGHGDEAWMVKVHVYLETVGGLGSATAEFFPDQNLIDKNLLQVWQRFVVTNTADTNGQLEIRLHFDKNGFTTDKWVYIHGWYDDVSMGWIPAPIIIPPYRILSFTLMDQTATWTWESVSNELYSIQASPDLSSWSTFQSNLLATGDNLTFTTNVSLSNPQFFRIHRP